MLLYSHQHLLPTRSALLHDDPPDMPRTMELYYSKEGGKGGGGGGNKKTVWTPSSNFVELNERITNLPRRKKKDTSDQTRGRKGYHPTSIIVSRVFVSFLFHFGFTRE